MEQQSPKSSILSLFMSYLSHPAISFVLYKVAFWDGQDQTHIFLVFSTVWCETTQGIGETPRSREHTEGDGRRGGEGKKREQMSREEE